ASAKAQRSISRPPHSAESRSAKSDSADAPPRMPARGMPERCVCQCGFQGSAETFRGIRLTCRGSEIPDIGFDPGFNRGRLGSRSTFNCSEGEKVGGVFV